MSSQKKKELPMAEFKWNKDHFAEQQMKKMKVQWSIVDVSIDDIDWEGSEANTARPQDKIDNAFVEELSIAIKNGDHLPMPVLLLVKKGKFIIYSGNHRLRGARIAGVESFPAYVFESNDVLVLSNLQKALNPPTLSVPRAARLAFARDAHMNGMKASAAAKLFSLNESSLHNFIRAMKTRKELAFLGQEKSEKIPTAIITSLSRIKNEHVLQRAARLVSEAKMTTDETNRMVFEINEARTESAQINVVANHEVIMTAPVKKDNETTIAKPKRSHGATVKSALGTLEKLSHVRNINQWGVTDRDEKTRLVSRIRALCVRLEEVCSRSN